VPLSPGRCGSVHLQEIRRAEKVHHGLHTA
jgi:hypothetical protein